MVLTTRARCGVSQRQDHKCSVVVLTTRRVGGRRRGTADLWRSASFVAGPGELGLRRTWQVGVVTLAVILLFAPLAVSSLRSAARRALPRTLAALSIGWSTWLLGNRDVATAVAAGLRILILVLPGSLLVAHLDTSRLGDDLAQRLRLPDRPVVAAVAALQRIEDLGTIWSQASWARRVRGLTAGGSPVARTREIAALDLQPARADGTAIGADGRRHGPRGFAGAHHRSWAEPSRWRPADSILLAIGLAVGACRSC